MSITFEVKNMRYWVLGGIYMHNGCSNKNTSWGTQDEHTSGFHKSARTFESHYQLWKYFFVQWVQIQIFVILSNKNWSWSILELDTGDVYLSRNYPLSIWIIKCWQAKGGWYLGDREAYIHLQRRISVQPIQVHGTTRILAFIVWACPEHCRPPGASSPAQWTSAMYFHLEWLND